MARSSNSLAKLQQFIEEKHHLPRSRLPPERELAVALDLTRSQLRTAMRQLAKDGVIWRQVGKGTFIAEPSEDETPKSTVVRSVNPRELVDARLALEPRMARLAAVSASDADLARMDLCIENCKRSKTWEEFAKWDASLHMAIAEAARNTLLLELYHSITGPEQGWVWGRLKQRVLTSERQAEATLEHTGFVAAIRNRDMDEAERLMRRHLEVTQSRMTATTYQSPAWSRSED